MSTFRVMGRDECGTEYCLENHIPAWKKDERMDYHNEQLSEEMGGIWLEPENVEPYYDNEPDDGYDYDRYY